jgi:hypothetical protein
MQIVTADNDSNASVGKFAEKVAESCLSDGVKPIQWFI